MKTLFILKFTTVAICILILSVSLFQENVNGQAKGWEFLNGPMAPGGVVDALVISPSEPDTLFTIIGGASGQRLFRSDDDSLTWQQVLTFTDVISEEITSLAIDPLSAETLYAGSKGRLMLSGNGGITWTQIFTMGAAIAVADTNHLYVADKIGEPDSECFTGYFGVARSANRGSKWNVTSIGCADSFPFLLVHPNDVNILYIGGAIDTLGTILKSIDGGENFDVLSISGRGTHPIQDLVIMPTDPQKLFASDEYGIFFSENGGDSWTRFTSWGVGFVPANQDLPQAPFALSIDSSGTIYAIDKSTSQRGITTYRSDDGGKTWWSAIQKLPNGARVIKPDPQVAGKLYVGLDGFGIWKTDSSGGTWTEQNVGIRSIVQVESLAVRLNDPTTIYAASYYGNRPGLFHSKDGGLSWTTVLTDTPVRAVEINPLTLTQVLAGTDIDLWTTNDGSNWYRSYVEQLVTDFAISKAGSHGWYAVGVKKPFDFDNGVRLAQGQFLKFDPGDPSQGEMPYWGSTPISGTGWALQIAVDPIDPYTVYMIVSLDPYDVIYRSTDGGNSWHEFLELAPNTQQLLIDERFPNRIYVSGVSGTLFSLNRGVSWIPLLNGPGRIIHRVALDDSGNVCAGTENGVWCQYDKRDIWYKTGLENIWIRSLVTSRNNANEQWMYAGTATGVWRRKFEPVQINSIWLPLVQK